VSFGARRKISGLLLRWEYGRGLHRLFFDLRLLLDVCWRGTCGARLAAIFGLGDPGNEQSNH